MRWMDTYTAVDASDLGFHMTPVGIGLSTPQIDVRESPSGEWIPVIPGEPERLPPAAFLLGLSTMQKIGLAVVGGLFLYVFAKRMGAL